MHNDSRAVAIAIQLSRHSGGGVHHQHVASPEVVSETIENCVLNTGRGCDHEPDAIAPQPAELGRLGRRTVVRRGEVREGPGGQHGAHSDRVFSASVTATSAARYRPLGRPELIRATTMGATVSGSGRSLMSSPGNAAWCMAVRMSPGSKLYQVNSGSSAAHVSV